MSCCVDEVTGDQMVMMTNEDDPVEVVENEEPGEEETGAPERIRHPGVQVVIVPRRRVVSDYRRALIVVVIV